MHSPVKEDIKIVSTAACIFANEARLICFLNGSLQNSGFVVELSTNIDVCRGTVHGSSGDEAPFYELVGIFAHYLSIFTCSGLSFVSVHDKVARFRVLVPVFGIHERLCTLAYAGSLVIANARTHFIPDGNPAPPRPRRPEAFISEIIYGKSSVSLEIPAAVIM